MKKLKKLKKKLFRLISQNDLMNTRGVYLIVRVQTGVFDRQEAFILITVVSSTKLIHPQQKYQKKFKKFNHRFNSIQLIRLGRLEIQCSFKNPTKIPESPLRVTVLPSLV